MREVLQELLRTYHESEIESDDDCVGDGHGGELEVPEVAGEGLGDDVHAVDHHSAERGWADDPPQLLRLDPDPRPQPQLLVISSLQQWGPLLSPLHCSKFSLVVMTRKREGGWSLKRCWS